MGSAEVETILEPCSVGNIFRLCELDTGVDPTSGKRKEDVVGAECADAEVCWNGGDIADNLDT